MLKEESEAVVWVTGKERAYVVAVVAAHLREHGAVEQRSDQRGVVLKIVAPPSFGFSRSVQMAQLVIGKGHRNTLSVCPMHFVLLILDELEEDDLFGDLIPVCIR